MAQAIELARMAKGRDEVPVGAVLVHDNQMIGFGANQREQTSRTVAHAEIIALEDYNSRFKTWRLPKDTSLFVTAEPCMMCTGALLWARLDYLFFGCLDTKRAGLVRILPFIYMGVFDHRFKKVQGEILATDCRDLLTDFFRQKRRGEESLSEAE